VDASYLLSYTEATDGQLLMEGITEAGSMASFTAAGTSYANQGEPMLPFFIFYSMFGFQRMGDLAWAFGDARGRGFLLGATAGRTTLSGEGLQHQDGHSILLASVVPNCLIYDPAYAYEIAVIIEEGIRRMLENSEDIFYYLTLYNENYVMPAMPEDCREGIIRGIYRYRAASKGAKPQARLFGSGPILRAALKAQEILEGDYHVAVDVWSVTSYSELRREAIACDRWNRLHPSEAPRIPYILSRLENTEGPIIAVTDYIKSVPDLIRPWIPSDYITLGTDGFGRSDTREALRRFFEIDAPHIVVATLSALSRKMKINPAIAMEAIRRFRIDTDLPNPANP
jgi:pyruvate dehydrogenase E1 component